MFDLDFGDFNDTDFNFESLSFDTSAEYTVSTGIDGVGNDLGLSTYDPDAVAEDALDLAETEAESILDGDAQELHNHWDDDWDKEEWEKILKAKAILAGLLLLVFLGVVGYVIYEERK
ncbi:hypothetical protein F4212_01815 [Candidatus Poribacteria bacterium]|nr:hypothetical protein [Candidatus Poribacteria bacterium]